MIQLQISELIKAKKVEWNRKITINEVADSTGISRMTLFRMMKNTNHNTVTDHLDSLCTFFECDLNELVRYVPTTNAKSPKNAVNKNDWERKLAA